MKWNIESVRGKAKQLHVDAPTKAFIFVDSDYFPNIYILLVISSTLPKSSCECERILNGLAMMQI